MDPRNAGAYVNLGVCKQGLGDFMEAAVYFVHAIEVYPHCSEAIINLKVQDILPD